MEKFLALKLYQNTIEKVFGFSLDELLSGIPDGSKESIEGILGTLSEELLRLSSDDLQDNLRCVSDVVEELLMTSEGSTEGYYLGRLHQFIISNLPKRFR